MSYFNNDDCKNELKTRLEEYLRNRISNFNPSKNFNCLNPQHTDNHPSMKFYANNNTCHCFSCGATYDILHLIAIDHNKDSKKDFQEILQIGCQMFNIPIPEYKQTENHYIVTEGPAYYTECHKNVNQTRYFEKRGITEETVNRFNLGFDPHHRMDNNRYMQAVIIPTSDHSHVARNTYPEAKNEDKVRKTRNTKSEFLNIAALDNTEPVFIVEGEFDALSILQLGFEAISLGGVNNIEKLCDIIKTKDSIPYLILALDNDEAGKDTTEKLKILLKKLKVQHSAENICPGFKDANEALVKNRDQLKTKLTDIVKNIKEKESRMDELKAIIQVITQFPAKKWNSIGETLLLASELNDEDQKKIKLFIQKLWEEKKS